MVAFLTQHGLELIVKTWQQIYIAIISLSLGIIVAIPLSVFLLKIPRIAKIIISITSILQTIPALALLAMMIPLFGVGRLPAIIALFLYSLMPILRNTYVGLTNVDTNIIDSARGLGMTKIQLITKVRLPLAMPVIMAGIRLAAIYIIAWATLASYIGAGGLGDFIFSGLSLYQPDLILGGTLPVIALALLTDFLLGLLEKKIIPKGI
ncbi:MULTISPECIES: ABC transporter permease [unclassified Lactobacillus]|uniref:ABC transporter permease n=1 Tax=unclassified Lactobacillus TaxID=2620435 RepID=UPI000EFB3B80|nr:MULTISPECIES: ABC transporter permease [unclassified Lactobacillus]RMC40768.1 ABC transporter permease [Lactobacillus sp. ESL0237]RMC44524.1 ABC transporter permease [Lactobacillus sp. ESL0234]RMC45831.1 ABC transporter permease [Lactobacillus sp. ESL0236]RMC46168.1 ABC transporter permease [Lactobacillus sp. ESL0230]RMC51221.1 ABC transporter permease [Lactobacillus sp. ESL0225]